MVTLKEIALECGVTATTVSNILNGKAKASEETVRRVLETVEKLGYRPNLMAKGLRSQKSGMIGIISEDIAQFTTPSIVEGIMQVCETKGYRTVMTNLRLYARWSDAWYDDDRAYHSILDPTIKELDSIMVDGVIYVAGHARHVHCFPENYRTPAVMAYAYAANPRVPSVLIDDEQSAYEIVRYLIDKGHRKIAILGGIQDNIHTQKRLLGAQKALFEASIPFNPDSVRFVNWNREPAYEVSKDLLDTGATAVFCMTDRMAGGVYEYASEAGLVVGRDISIVGYDDQDLASYMIPQLTTMRLPLVEIGRISAELLFKQIENGFTVGEQGAEDGQEHIQKETYVPSTFVGRDSVADLTEQMQSL